MIISMTRQSWSKHEDDCLVRLVQTYGTQWGRISSNFTQELNPIVNLNTDQNPNPIPLTGPPMHEETIADFPPSNLPQNLHAVSGFLEYRNPKQCRERWYNHLDPSVTKIAWTNKEDSLIFRFVTKYGSQWANLSKLLPGRSDNAIKNRWNSSIKKRIRIDPDGSTALMPEVMRRGKNQSPNSTPASLVVSSPHDQEIEEAPCYPIYNSLFNLSDYLFLPDECDTLSFCGFLISWR